MIFSVFKASFSWKTKPVYHYQLDFTTPGSLPCDARSLKHMRHIPNFRKKPLGLPQIGHLLYALTLNLGFRIAFILSAVLAKSSPSYD